MTLSWGHEGGGKRGEVQGVTLLVAALNLLAIAPMPPLKPGAPMRPRRRGKEQGDTRALAARSLLELVSLLMSCLHPSPLTKRPCPLLN